MSKLTEYIAYEIERSEKLIEQLKQDPDYRNADPNYDSPAMRIAKTIAFEQGRMTGMERLRIQCAEDMAPSDPGEISDGYHTFNELYAHRSALFIALMRQLPGMSWRSRLQDDGTSFPGWFLAGMGLPTGMISYHLADQYWAELDDSGIYTFPSAPKWDGHMPKDVVTRLLKWRKPDKVR